MALLMVHMVLMEYFDTVKRAQYSIDAESCKPAPFQKWPSRNTKTQHALRHTAKHYNTMLHTATQSMYEAIMSEVITSEANTLLHTAKHCNILQHAATRCNILQHTSCLKLSHLSLPHCNILQHTATRSNTMQHADTHTMSEAIKSEANTLHTLQHTATHCSALQHDATNCNTHHV